MRNHVAGVVTISDLYQYFTGSENQWESDLEGDTFTAKSPKKRTEVTFTRQQTLFHVHFEAVDDPSDSDDIVSDKPIEALAKLLGEGVPGGEHFEKMSSDPNAVRSALRYAASLTRSRSIGPRKLASILRRIVVLTEQGLHTTPGLSHARQARENVDMAEISSLEKEMKKKGWKVKETRNSAGIMALEVDISGIYSSTISVDSIKYSYELLVMGEPDATDSGTTNDPIDIYERWTKRPETQDAKSRSSETAKGVAPTQPAESQDDVTIKPESKPKSFRDDATVPPPTRKSE